MSNPTLAKLRPGLSSYRRADDWSRCSSNGPGNFQAQFLRRQDQKAGLDRSRHQQDEIFQTEFRRHLFFRFSNFEDLSNSKVAIETHEERHGPGIELSSLGEGTT